MTTALLTLAAIVVAAPFALMALHWLLLSYSREQGAAVADAVRALPDLPLHLKAEALLCFDQAAEADQKTALYDVTAPLVMMLALPFVKRGANRLPRLFRKWDNNISINGDGETVLRDGQWVNLRDIGWMPEPGERVYTYDDPAYTGDAYYAKGHHPRSFWARWVWLGWRNRASQLSVDLGRDVAARPVCISGDTTITRSKPGHFLLRDGASYHFKSIERVHLLGTSWALTRSYGYKLEHALYRPAGDYGRAAAVAIGWSLKRWKD